MPHRFSKVLLLLAGLTAGPLSAQTPLQSLTLPQNTGGNAAVLWSSGTYKQGQLVISGVNTCVSLANQSSTTAPVLGTAGWSCWPNDLSALTAEANTARGNENTIAGNLTTLSGTVTTNTNNIANEVVRAQTAESFAVTSQLPGGYQALYLPYRQGVTSGTVLQDYNPTCVANGGGTATGCNNGSIDTAVTWTSTGSGLIFPGNSLHSVAGIPAAAVSGAQTIILAVSMTTPGGFDGSHDQTVIFSDANTNFIDFFPSQQISHSTKVGTGSVGSLDRLIGPVVLGYTYPTTGLTGYQYINGAPPKTLGSQITSTSPLTWGGSSQALLGALSGSTYFNSTMVFYGLVIYPTVLTQAQMYQASAALQRNITAGTGVQFGSQIPQNNIFFAGDSIFHNLGENGKFQTSIPYYEARNAGFETFTNLAISGQSLLNMRTALPVQLYPYWDGAGPGQKVLVVNAVTNDVAAGQSSANIIAAGTGVCSDVKGRYPGAKVALSTSLPRGTLTAAQETVREAINSSWLSSWLAGGWACDAVIDESNSPIAETTVSPNLYAAVGTIPVNTTYWLSDAVHPINALNSTFETLGGCTIKDALGRMNQPCWIDVPLPAVVPKAFSGTSQTLPLLQLGPGWDVCGVRAEVTTAFTGVSPLTYSIGDTASGLSTTTYQAATDMTTLGSAVSTGAGMPTGSKVTVTFNGGAALSGITAGAMVAHVCVVHP